MNTDIIKFKEKLFEEALKNGFSDAEILYYKSNSFSVSIFEGEINQYKNSNSNGVSFRGTFNGNMGYSFTEKVLLDEIPLLIENAKLNATILSSDEDEELFYTDEKYKEVNNYYPDLETVLVDEKIKLAKEIEKEALNYSDKVTKVTTTVVANGLTESYMANTKGLELSDISNIAYAYTQVVAEENESKKVGFAKWIGTSFDDLNPKDIALDACSRAIKSLNAKPIKSEKLNVVFSNESFCDMLSVFSSSFFAENVQRGFSKLKDKLGEKIASDILTIRDDAFFDKSIIKTSFDSEGVPCSNKVVIENGVLKTYLYNTKTAKKDNVKPTGNGYRGSTKSPLSTSTTNFYVVPSENENIFKNIKKGVLITDLSGLHAGVNTISGDFSLSFDGFLIEDEKVTSPIEQMTVSGNFYDMLFDIKEIGNDLVFDFPDGIGAIGSTSVLVDSLTVSGL